MSFDWSSYTGNLDWLPEYTIYLTLHGSHAYGTNIATSDTDIRGVCIPPMRYVFGFLDTFEQATQSAPDLTIFSLQKFFALAANCNPNALEILFTDEAAQLYVHDAMRPLLDSKELFLSQQAKHTFSGYAVSQLKRINLHYRWLKNPPQAPPSRSDFGLPDRSIIPKDQMAAVEATIRKQMDTWAWRDLELIEPSLRQSIQDEFERRLVEVAKWSDVEGETYRSAAKSLNFSDNFIELLVQEKQYNAKLREWQNYQEWKKNRNPARAELEAKFGYDTKHGMHLVRLLRMCREVLEGKGLIVRRPDAEELLAIRAGNWSYEDLVAWAEKQDTELAAVAKTSTLPRTPNRKALNVLCVRMTDAYLRTMSYAPRTYFARV